MDMLIMPLPKGSLAGRFEVRGGRVRADLLGARGLNQLAQHMADARWAGEREVAGILDNILTPKDLASLVDETASYERTVLPMPVVELDGSVFNCSVTYDVHSLSPVVACTNTVADTGEAASFPGEGHA